MKVYVVTEGCYSDYHIMKIFSDPVKAHMFSMLGDEWEERRVETFEIEEGELNIKQEYVRIIYNYCYDEIDAVLLEKESYKPQLVNKDYYQFTFTVPLSNERLFNNIKMYGKNCKLIRKITEDTFAQYCYEHSTSKEELIEKQKKKFRGPNYMFYTSTSVLDDLTHLKEAEERVTAALKQMAINKEMFPEIDVVQKMYDDALQEVKQEHEQD